ncbi:MAG TPA: hypothetical protein VGG02_14025 [Chthoniobacterales bacterium]|jgi:hypothetical protein
MKFPRSIETWGTTDFKTELEDELGCQRREFDFEEYSRKDYPDDVWNEFVVSSFRDVGETIEADCSVDFDDCSATACQDMVDRENARAFFTLSIDKETAEGTIEPDREARYNAEYY